MIKIVVKKMKSLLEQLKNEKAKNIFKPHYKLVDILQEEEQYIAIVKLINKNITFNIKPEELLADDNLVDQFSPRDIRALTYLGYLGINSPKYKILARKLSENEKINFILKKRGDKEIIVKTAVEINNESGIIGGMSSEDAKTIGYTMASETIVNENKQKAILLKSINDHNSESLLKKND